MNDRTQADNGPIAPRRPLTGAGKDQAAASGSSGSTANQQTMATPVVTDRPSAAEPTSPSREDDAGRTASAGQPSSAQSPPRQAPRPRRQPAAASDADPATEETAPVPAATRAPARTRKARLRLVRLDPWSVMKVAFALSIALAIVTVVAVAIVWSVLGAAGVWEAINSSVGTVLDENESGFDVTDYVGMSRVLGLTAIVSAANVVLLTAIATLAAFLYNLTAALLGGLEVTLAEDR